MGRAAADVFDELEREDRAVLRSDPNQRTVADNRLK